MVDHGQKARVLIPASHRYRGFFRDLKLTFRFVRPRHRIRQATLDPESHIVDGDMDAELDARHQTLR